MTSIITTTPIEEGIDFILSHIQSPVYSGDIKPTYFDLWPKVISVDGMYMIRASSREQILYEFYKGNLKNCRIRAYPDYVDDYWTYAKDAMTIGGRGVLPNLILIDLDKGQFFGDLDMLLNALMKTLDRINEKFHGIFKPTIVWSGNGYHIYLPVQLSGPSWCLQHTDIFTELCIDPEKEFLRWVEPYLTDGKADPAHSKTVSLKNCYLRVPGTINGKNDSQVKIIQRWDGQRPCINWILRDFRRYLIQKTIKPEKKRATVVYSTNWDKRLSIH
jgi:hypothetical protein